MSIHNNKSKGRLTFVFAVVFLMGAVSGALAQETQPITVGVAVVQTLPQGRFIDMTGSVEAQETVPIAFSQAGRITVLSPQVGDVIAAGDVIAELDPAQAVTAERAVAANLAAATASLSQAEQAYTRARDLLARGAGTQADLDAAEQAFLGAAARRDEAAAGLAKARQTLNDMIVTAPIDGIVIARAAEQGQIAAAGQSVVTIARGGAREAVFALPNEGALDTMIGADITVHLLDDPAVQAIGQVAEVAPVMQAQTGTVTLKITLPEAATGFGLGAAVQARFPLSQDTTITLPAMALTTDRGAHAVWVIDPDTKAVSLRPVTVTAFTSTTFDVSDGIEEGEWVATAGAHQLYPNRPVTPRFQGDAP